LGQRQAEGLQALIDLADNDLLDLLLARVQPEGELDRPVVHEVLAQLRTPAHRAG
jgi:antitoxin CptB